MQLCGSLSIKEIPHVQCQEQGLRLAGGAVSRYPTSKVRSCTGAVIRNPSKMVGRVNSCLEPNLIPASDAQGAQTTSCIPGPRDPTETEQNCWASPVDVQVSSGLPQGQRLWVQHTWVWHKPSGRRLPLTAP